MTMPHGPLIARRFLVEGSLGTGGMGTVHVAVDQETGQRVALKLLQSTARGDDAERFAREAQILSDLRHPHIVGHVAHGADELGRQYLAMELLVGEDLRQRLRRGRMTVAESMALLDGASAALAEAHRIGIVHRDLKPSNLFLRDGDPAGVVVLDFGVARRLLRSSLTHTGLLVGTPEYMAPEQARGGIEIGPAVDVFALGCVLYECLSGQAPHSGEHVAAVLSMVLFEEPPLLQGLRESLPAPIAELMTRMLHKDPAERYPNGLALHEVVRRIVARGHAASGSLAPTMPSLATALSPQEQQLFSLAVAVPRGSHPAEPRELIAGVLRPLRGFGAEVDVLADGSVIARVFQSVSASDQALLAARCGLLLRESLPDHAVAVATGLGQLRGRIPIGESIDRALAMVAAAGAAPLNGVLVDDLSERLLAGRLQMKRYGARTLLIGDQDREAETRRLLGLRTACVGREQELASLEAALATCVDDSAARAIGVVGPPGIGKSRLRHEFTIAAAQRHPELLVMVGRGDLMNNGSVYGSLVEAIRRLCEVAAEQPAAIQQERLRRRIGRHLAPAVAGRIVGFFGEMCGVPGLGDGERAVLAARQDPKVMRDQVMQAFLDWLRAELQRQPVLLVLEDLQWGDAASLQFVEQALRELHELPLCVLALARPEVQALFPAFWSSSTLQVLPLRPLARRACERLAHDVLRRALGDVAPEVIGRIVAQSAGNPLFLEELVRAVAEGRGDELPETVLSMLMARLSQLDPGARQALCAGSVFGETFTRGGAAALLGEEPPAIDGSLALLVRAELIERQRDSDGLAGERFKFRHALVRDAAYGLLTAENRVVAHRLACAYLEQQGGAGPAALAEHAQKGHVLGLAGRLHVEAARQALANFDLDAACAQAERALACDVKEVQLGEARAILASVAYFRLEQLSAYMHAMAAVDVLPPGSLWWARALGICFSAFLVLRRHTHAARLSRAFLAAEPLPEARGAYVAAGSTLSTFFAARGLRRACRQLVDKIEIGSVGLEPHELGHLHLTLAWRGHYLDRDHHATLRAAERAVELLRAAGDENALAQAMFCLGLAAQALGQSARAEATMREAMALSLGLGDAFYAVMIFLHIGLFLAEQPDPAAQDEAGGIAATFCDQAELGPAAVGVAHVVLGLVRLREGRPIVAERAFELAVECFAGMLPYRVLVVPVYVDLLLRQERPAEALRIAEDTMARIEVQGGLGAGELQVRLAVVEARLAGGDAAGGRVALREALAELRRRVDRIEDPGLRGAFLERPENRRLHELGRALAATT